MKDQTNKICTVDLDLASAKKIVQDLRTLLSKGDEAFVLTQHFGILFTRGESKLRVEVYRIGEKMRADLEERFL